MTFYGSLTRVTAMKTLQGKSNVNVAQYTAISWTYVLNDIAILFNLIYGESFLENLSLMFSVPLYTSIPEMKEESPLCRQKVFSLLFPLELSADSALIKGTMAQNVSSELRLCEGRASRSELHSFDKNSTILEIEIGLYLPH